MSREVRVVLIVEGSESYGVRRFLLQAARALSEEGSLAGVISLEDGPLTKNFLDDGLDVEVLGLLRAPNFRHGVTGALSSAMNLAIYTLRAIPLVRRALRRFRAEAAVTRMPNLLPIVGFAARAESTASFWLMPNAVNEGYPLNINKVLYKVFFKVTDLIPIANSEYTASTLPRRHLPYEAMHLGISPDDFAPDGVERRRELGLAPDDQVFGIFARLRPEKGQLQFVRAVSEFVAKEPRIKILIIGGPSEGHYYEEMLREVEALRLCDNVLMIGEKSDLSEYYRTIDVLVNCRLDAEPFGLSVIEGLLSGKPVLAHRLGGPGETVLDGETGWLMGGSLEDFREGIRRALEDSSRWPAMGRRACKYARREFSAAAASRRLLAIVQKYAS